jgi:hypothetical protein
VGIHENTSWSCHHGVARWAGPCSCTPGDGNWKIHLRRGLDRLAGALDNIYLDNAHPLIRDPWLLRHRYIHVLLGEITLEGLLGEMASRALTSAETHRLGLLLEAQRERQRMFTSCGWYYEDFDRIEPRNNVAYAAQAVRLTRQAAGVDLEPEVSRNLRRVASPRTGLHADTVFRRHLRRAESPY